MAKKILAIAFLLGPSLTNNRKYNSQSLGQTWLTSLVAVFVRSGQRVHFAMAPESPETPVPAKCRKTEEDSTIAAQLSMCIKDNKELHKKLDAFDPSKIVEVVTQAVAGGYHKPSQNRTLTKNSRQVKAQIPLANHISGHLENLRLLLALMAA